LVFSRFILSYLKQHYTHTHTHTRARTHARTHTYDINVIKDKYYKNMHIYTI